MGTPGASRFMRVWARLGAGTLSRWAGWVFACVLCTGCAVLIDESFEGYKAEADGGMEPKPPRAGAGGAGGRMAMRDGAGMSGGSGGEDPQTGSGGDAGRMDGSSEAGSGGDGGSSAGGGASASGGAGAENSGAGGSGGSANIGGEPGSGGSGGNAGVGAGGVGGGGVGGGGVGGGGVGGGGAGGELAAGTPGGTVRAGDGTQASPISLGDGCMGAATLEFTFDTKSELALFEVAEEYELDPLPVPGYSEVEGSPSAGAISIDATYLPGEVLKLSTDLGDASPVTCLSMRLKLANADPAELSAHPAAWLLFAQDASWCYAQVEIETGWRHELDRAGVWYELSSATSTLESSCAFNPQRVRIVGFGVASNVNSPPSWQVQMFADAFRLH